MICRLDQNLRHLIAYALLGLSLACGEGQFKVNLAQTESLGQGSDPDVIVQEIIVSDEFESDSATWQANSEFFQETDGKYQLVASLIDDSEADFQLGTAVGMSWDAGSSELGCVSCKRHVQVYFPLDELAENTVEAPTFDVRNFGRSAIHGKDDNGVTYGQPGRFGTALVFDASNQDYIETESKTVAHNLDFTVSVWIYPLSTRPAGEGGIISENKAFGDNAWGLTVTDDGRISYKQWDGQFVDANRTTAAGVISSDAWNHIALVRDRENLLLTLYIDGVVVPFDSNVATEGGANSPELRIGREDNANYFDGRIDEILIFDYMLSAAEISELATATSAFESPHQQFFTSQIFDSRLDLSWSELEITTTQPARRSLKSNQINESGFRVDNIDMTDNILLFSFDESAYSGVPNEVRDSSGLQHHGTAVGLSTTSSEGLFGRALDLTAGDVAVEVADSSHFDNITALTLSAWVYRTDRPGLSGGKIFSKDSNSGTDYDFSLEYGDFDVKFEIRTVGGNDYDLFADREIRWFNTWNHIAATWEGSTMTLYVNGEVAGTNSTVTENTLENNNQNLYIGNSKIREFQDVVGYLDEMAIWKRQLSAAEIASLYRRGSSGLEFQVRACDNPDCTGVEWVGPNGSPAWFDIADTTDRERIVFDLSSLELNARYFQYRSRVSALEPTLIQPGFSRVEVRPSDDNLFDLVLENTLNYETIEGINATVSDDVRFQISVDGGETWLYFAQSEGRWLDAGSSLSNRSDLYTINLNLGTLPRDGQFRLKSIHQSGQNPPSSLESIDILYRARE